MYMEQVPGPQCWRVDVEYLGKVWGEEVSESWTWSWAAAIASGSTLLEMDKESAIIWKAAVRAPELSAKLGCQSTVE